MAISNDPEVTVSTSQTLPFTVVQLIPLSLFCFLMSFFGILGNGTVLYSSLRYNAIRLDRVSVVLIQNLAVADVLYTITNIIPRLITYITGKWVLGTVYCFISAHFSFILGSANAFIVLLITSYRLLLVTRPLAYVTLCSAKLALVVVWVFASTGTMISLLYEPSSTFNPRSGKCMSGAYDDIAAQVAVQFAVGIILVVPLFVITFENLVLCAIALKKSRSQANSTPNFKALLMVCALSGLFITSWTRYTIYIFMKSNRHAIPPALEFLAFHCIFINCSGNPILYTITNKRFAVYVRGLLRKVYSCLCGKSTSSWADLPVRLNTMRSGTMTSITRSQEQDPSTVPQGDSSV